MIAIVRAVVVLALAGVACGAAAQGYPTKPVRIINPFAPGGATDQLARLMAQKLTELWGQSVVVENRPGASGAIGLEAVAKSPPDGYTLAIATQTTHAANPALYAKLPVRPGARLRAAHARRLDAARADGAAVARRRRRRRPDRLPAQESRQAHLRLGRQRHLAAPDDGAPRSR